jgi:protein-S-isoprenylcysteine O-methyltransferase Ste14
MEQTSFLSNIVSFAVIAACWVIFGAALLLRRGSSLGEHRTREPLSWIGLVMQLISYPIGVTGFRSTVFSPFVTGQSELNIMLQLLAACIGAYSAWLAMAAIKELGVQWSLQARVLDDHKLVTSGVYRTVRHPIYTAMLGMLISTGLVISHWLVLAIALIIFLAGTKIRVHLEEKLLAEAFGEDFASWRSRVPALIPFVHRSEGDTSNLQNN